MPKRLHNPSYSTSAFGHQLKTFLFSRVLLHTAHWRLWQRCTTQIYVLRYITISVQSLADKKVLMVLDRHASHKWLVATAYAPENSCDYDLPTTAFYIPASYLMQPSVGSLCIWTTEDCIQC